MISEFILKKAKFGTKDEDRSKITFLSGIFGLILNLLLSVLKVGVGLFTGSISILADAINNVSDTFSSVVTIASAKFSDKPADKNHPQGYGRIEYLATLLVSLMILFVGFQFIQTSVDRILNPKPVRFDYTTVVILAISISVKILMNYVYRKLGHKINSSTLIAAATDSISDVFITSVVLISFIIDSFIDLPIDGYIGLLVSAVIIWAGFGLIKETVSSLIGEAPSNEFFDKLIEKVTSYEEIISVHDIIVNSFGPEKTIVVMDAEVPYYLSLTKIHRVVDRIEKEVSQDMGIHLVIHIDPVGNEDPEEIAFINILQDIIDKKEELCSFHDLSIHGKELTVHVTVDGHEVTTHEKEDSLIEFLKERLEMEEPKYDYIIDVDKRFEE